MVTECMALATTLGTACFHPGKPAGLPAGNALLTGSGDAIPTDMTVGFIWGTREELYLL